MADAWGGAWGDSWDGSWGRAATSADLMADAWGGAWGDSWDGSWGRAAISADLAATEARDTLLSAGSSEQHLNHALLRMLLAQREKRRPAIEALLAAGERRDSLMASATLGFDPAVMDGDFMAMAA